MYYDRNGDLVTDASEWGSYFKGWGLKDGAQRMSGYRDLGLSVVVDLLAGALSGMSFHLKLFEAVYEKKDLFQGDEKPLDFSFFSESVTESCVGSSQAHGENAPF